VEHGPFLSLSLKGGGRQLEGVGSFIVGGAGGGGARGAGVGADTRCDRSRMDAWRSAMAGSVCCSWEGGMFAS